ncbi:Intermembrane transporter PqiABC lipoprotein subunit PqiC (PqiC) (PDB:6OSX) (PUBMED:27795327) [Commensalibacter communis]|uniref:PqiC family protein n=1 Tax=Commensalibacter communis TaxID=2972786 RepID=UPI0022FF556B|nr:PqiC family protein [Commensalibacter communis]CAI3942301.1 Intermembrane transporter PqiABC lipoprotein subunit PqiC (PqiC) (PDB:6OSX) (PUBMED:27795327) [Commensalibacter communis]CAI3943589.1 Intermembrane transporter PqiABC lipoprotein subunit PqiC (PqiC) (PDB:6OSX) (PUBMED:27795327) [Commensalibacter communis]
MNKIITYCSLSALAFFAGCAAPSLQYYTLTEGNPTSKSAQTFTPTNNASTIYIARVTVPDYLNTTDITTRNGTALTHSVNGRLSSILSVGATGLITNLLTDKNPNLWITDEAPVSPPAYQVRINIRRFDLQAETNKIGTLNLEASWSIIPQNDKAPIQKQRTSFVVQGSIQTDNDIVKLEQNALTQLTNNINTTIQQLR